MDALRVAAERLHVRLPWEVSYSPLGRHKQSMARHSMTAMIAGAIANALSNVGF